MPEYLHQKDNLQQSRYATRPSWLLLAIATGFAVGAFFINRTITQKYWEPNLGVYSARVEGLALHTEGIDTVFVGSSHLLYGVDPLVFDDSREHFESGESYNMGVQSAIMPTQLHTLQKLGELQLPRLRYVFFEPMLLDSPVAGPVLSLYNEAFHIRNRYHYDLDSARMTIHSRWNSERALDKRLAGVIAIGFVWAIHASNLGVIRDVVFPLHEVSDAAGERAWARRGLNVRLEKAELGEFGAPDLELGYRPISDAELAVLDRMIREIKSLDAEPIILLPPTRRRAGWHVAIRDAVYEHFPNIKKLDYNYDSNQLELYSQPELWVDEDHLNRKGAKVFSAILARDWIQHVRSKSTDR